MARYIHTCAALLGHFQSWMAVLFNRHMMWCSHHLRGAVKDPSQLVLVFCKDKLWNNLSRDGHKWSPVGGGLVYLVFDPNLFLVPLNAYGPIHQWSVIVRVTYLLIFFFVCSILCYIPWNFTVLFKKKKKKIRLNWVKKVERICGFFFYFNVPCILCLFYVLWNWTVTGFLFIYVLDPERSSSAPIGKKHIIASITVNSMKKSLCDIASTTTSKEMLICTNNPHKRKIE